MKKNLIPALLILALFAGCTSKSNNGTTDTTSTGGGTKSSGGPVTSTGVGNPPTMTLTPPSVVGGQAGAITVTAPANTRVLISTVFFGSDQTQKVTVWSGTPGQGTLLQTFSFSTGWASWVSPNDSVNPQTFTITDSLASAPYPNCGSSPVASGNNPQGFDVTTYSGNPPPKGQSINKSVIAVVDLCGQF